MTGTRNSSDIWRDDMKNEGQFIFQKTHHHSGAWSERNHYISFMK